MNLRATLLSILLLPACHCEAFAASGPEGAYAFVSTSMCEAKLKLAKDNTNYVTNVTLDVTKDGTGKVTNVAINVAKNAITKISDVTLTQPGAFSTDIGVITFTPTSMSGGKADLTKSRRVGGGSLRVGSNGSRWEMNSADQSGVPYSFTSSTFTLGDQLYQMSCADVAGGVCNTVFLVTQEKEEGNPNCLNTVSAVKK